MAADAESPEQETATSKRVSESQAPLALYRRYRPATFAELKGQDHVTEPLRQALRSGRVNHAYLFSGPRGCGKTSSARILARSLNCELGPTPDPCGKCASCVALAPSGPGSIDVIEIDAASHGGIDDARDLRERAFYSPVSARYKIYIIDEAHMVTGAGFNALLKLVEEPPPHLKFVFATTEPEKVIPTIRSRTHHYPFRLVPPAILRDLLEEILSAEKVSFEPSVLPVVVRAGAGSVRDSLSVLDQLIAGSGDEGLRYDRAIALLGYTDDALLDETVNAFAAGDGALVFKAIDHVVEGGHDPRRFAMDLLDRLRDLIVLAAVPDASVSGLLDIPDLQLESMAEQATRFGQARLVRAAETISNGLVEMRGATSPRLLLELMCAQVLLPASGAPSAPSQAAPAAGGPLDARVDRLERELRGALDRLTALTSAAGAAAVRPAVDPRESAAADRDDHDRGTQPPQRRQEQRAEQPRRPAPPQQEQTRPAGAGASAPASAGPPAAATGPSAASAGPGGSSALPDASVIRSRWPDVLESIREVRKVAWILLGNASIESVEGNVLTLAFEREGDAKGFGSSGCDQVLADVLERTFGVRPVIRTGVGSAPGRGGNSGGDRARSDGGRSDDAGAGSGRTNGGPSEQPSPASTDRSWPDAPLPDDGWADSDSGAAGRPAGDRPAANQRPPRPASAKDDSARPPGGRSQAKANGAPARNPEPVRQQAPSPTIYDDPREQTDPVAPNTVDVSGSDLIMRELGGRVIEEIGEG
jgi:DNA polymerase III subunit gamma/tau